MYCLKCGTQNQEEARFCSACGFDFQTVTAGGSPLAGTQQSEAPQDELGVVRDALKDDYEVLAELGRGGMAVVFRAREKELDREVAIKVLPMSLGFDKEFVERFQREARTAAKLEHPNIIPIYRVGRSGNVIFFAMKFLRGKSLADLIDEGGALQTSEIRRLLTETAGALGYAHKNGIVHRDIKPDNILLDDSGHAIITDFGIAKAATGTRLTGTGMAIGTPHYMSPEQARAQPLDGRSDIYSLGVVAYQCLTGKVPFDGTDAFSIGYKHITEEVPEPELATEDQRKLFAVVKRMMAKQPDERFQTAQELVAALQGRVQLEDSVTTRPTTPIRASAAHELQRATDATARMPPTPTTPIPGQEAGSGASDGGKRKKSKAPALIAASLVLIAGGGGGGYYYWANFMQSTSADPPVTPAEVGGQRDTGPEQARPVAAADSGTIDSTDVGSDSGDSLTVAEADSAAVGGGQVAPAAGTIVLAGLPEGADVQVAGRQIGGSTADVPPGEDVRILVTAPGMRDYDITHRVAAGETDTLAVRMERIPQPQCADPGRANYNLRNACFDRRPAPLDAPIVSLPSSYQGNPSPITVWVRVNRNGEAVQVAPVEPPDDPEFFALVTSTATEIGYTPASRNGSPVEGWAQVQFSPLRN